MKHEIRQLATELGFCKVGFCRADQPFGDAEFLSTWLAADRHAGMAYLARQADRRDDPRSLLPTARSLLVVGTLYPRPEPGSAIAGYALMEDYHREISERLTTILEFIRARQPDAEGVVCVDTKPLLERRAAALAGLGWIGKNTLLLDVEHGPWMMLGELILNLDLPPDEPVIERCGTCRACLDACPTDAFAEPFVLDAGRCLSYWTIEHRGEMPEPIRDAAGWRLFGCDECLLACPHGSRRQDDGVSFLARSEELVGLDAERAIALLEDGFNRNFKHHALSRAGKAGLLRNALTVLGNGGDPSRLPLVRRYLEHSDPGVRSHADWAASKLERAT